jgi:predicted transposase YdaD
MADRINREPPPRAAKLWTATSLLMGLRFSDDVTYSVLEGVQNMQESTTYQRILREGRTEGRVEGRVLEAQRVLSLIGRERFSEPDSANLRIIEEIHDLDQLESLIKRVLHPDVHDWNDLLGLAPDE